MGWQTMPPMLPPVLSTPVAAPVSARATRIVAAQYGPSFTSMAKNASVSAATASRTLPTAGMATSMTAPIGRLTSGNSR